MIKKKTTTKARLFASQMHKKSDTQREREKGAIASERARGHAMRCGEVKPAVAGTYLGGKPVGS